MDQNEFDQDEIPGYHLVLTPGQSVQIIWRAEDGAVLSERVIQCEVSPPKNWQPSVTIKAGDRCPLCEQQLGEQSRLKL